MWRFPDQARTLARIAETGGEAFYRGDLAEAMRGLFSKRERGLVPAFDRLAIETTGLADPAPIVSTLLAEPVLRHHFRLGSVIATVDAVNGMLQVAENPESVKQVAIADRLVLTKADITDAATVARLTRRLRELNPSASIVDAARELTLHIFHEFVHFALHLFHFSTHVENDLDAGEVDTQISGECQNCLELFEIVFGVEPRVAFGA